MCTSSVNILILLSVFNAFFSTINCKDEWENNEMFTIVWWTDLLYPHMKDNTEIKCLKSTCLSTKHHKKSHEKVVFVFYGTDCNPEHLPLPRTANDVWALLHEESPMNNFIFSHTLGIKLFNFTATFSRYSDFPLTTQFIPSINYLQERKPVAIETKNEFRAAGLAPVLYVQSHCRVASDRDRYIKELSKYIAIDSYGSCLNNKEMPAELNSTETYNSEAFLEFISRYKFHIAFENAICDDYFTEKLVRPWYVGSVPVYKGSKTIKDWTPNENSIILADDFESPRKLAEFMQELDTNDDLYSEFLQFKNSVTNKLLLQTLNNRTWGVNDENKLDFIRGYECFLCDEVNRIKGGRSFMKMGIKKHMNCPQPYVSYGDTTSLPNSDLWMREDWIESYWFAYDQAKAINNMLLNKENSSNSFTKYLMNSKFQH